MLRSLRMFDRLDKIAVSNNGERSQLNVISAETNSNMHVPSHLYQPSLVLLTDLYQLTMAFGYWKSGLGQKEAVFSLFFREQPFRRL